MAKKTKKEVELEAHEVGSENNPFENPDAALEEGSAANLAVLKGNEVEAPDDEAGIEDTEETKALRQEVKNIKESIDSAYWELSAKVAKISNEKLYKIWNDPVTNERYKTFDAYLSAECGFEKRKGYYLVQIHNYFNNDLRAKLAHCPEVYNEIVETAKTVGWTKASKLAIEQIITADNAQEVLHQVRNCSVKELDTYCKLKADELTDEQAEEREDENDLKQVNKNFKNLSLAQAGDIDRAVEMAMSKMKEGAKPGHALSLICLDYMSTNTAGEGKELDVAETMSKFESLLKVKIAVIDPQAGKIIYGEDSLRELSEKAEAAPDSEAAHVQ